MKKRNVQAGLAARAGTWLGGLLLIGGIAPGLAAQSPGQKVFEANDCGSCHSLQSEDAEHFDAERRSQRRGPPLDHAGLKYRVEWLTAWLQKPTTIRPAGVFPMAAVKPNADGKDQIDPAAVPAHPALSAADAEAAAAYLASLKPGAERLAEANATPLKLPLKIGRMNFSKFKGCAACHRDASDHGGVSGPELYTAWRRMTPEYLYSYIQNAAAWDRSTLMPVLELPDAEVRKLLGYFQQISGEESK